LFLRAEFGIEIEVQPFGAAHLQGLGDHHVPGEDGKNDEHENDATACNGGLAPNPYNLQLRLRKKAKGNAHQIPRHGSFWLPLL
jgi:hypothetical protein